MSTPADTLTDGVRTLSVTPKARMMVTELLCGTIRDLKDIRQSLYKFGIKTSYDNDRIICSPIRARGPNTNTYIHECNGLIIDRHTWKVIMAPPPSMRFNINTSISNKFLHQGLYKIYKVRDGTSVNFYYFDGQWRMSTTRGYDVHDVKLGNMTFYELFNECLAEYNITWGEFVGELSTTSCYSFGFRHDAVHKFKPSREIWFIQQVNLDSNSELYLCANDVSPIKSICTQEEYKEPVENLKQLYKLAFSALDVWIGDKSAVPCLGFILTSTDASTTFHSRLFIESSIAKHIRQTWYNNRTHNYCVNNELSKNLVVPLNSYLDSHVYETFLHMFPQYTDVFGYYGRVIDVIGKLLLDIDADVKPIECVQELPSISTKLLTKYAKTINNKYLDHIKTNIRPYARQYQAVKKMLTDVSSFYFMISIIIEATEAQTDDGSKLPSN